MFEKTKLNIDFYLRRLAKSKSVEEYLVNQNNLILFINRRAEYEKKKYEKILKNMFTV